MHLCYDRSSFSSNHHTLKLLNSGGLYMSYIYIFSLTYLIIMPNYILYYLDYVLCQSKFILFVIIKKGYIVKRAWMYKLSINLFWSSRVSIFPIKWHEYLWASWSKFCTITDGCRIIWDGLQCFSTCLINFIQECFFFNYEKMKPSVLKLSLAPN